MERIPNDRLSELAVGDIVRVNVFSGVSVDDNNLDAGSLLPHYSTKGKRSDCQGNGYYGEVSISRGHLLIFHGSTMSGERTQDAGVSSFELGAIHSVDRYGHAKIHSR